MGDSLVGSPPDLGFELGRFRNDIDCVFGQLLDDVSSAFGSVLDASFEFQGLQCQAAEVASACEAVIRSSVTCDLADSGAGHELLGMLLARLRTSDSEKVRQAEIDTVAALDRLAVIVQANDLIQQRMDHISTVLLGTVGDEVLALQSAQLRQCADHVRDVAEELVFASRELVRCLDLMDEALSAETLAMARLVDALRAMLVDREQGLLDVMVGDEASQPGASTAHLAAGAVSLLDVDIARVRETVRRILAAIPREIPSTECLAVLGESSRLMLSLSERSNRELEACTATVLAERLSHLESIYTTQHERMTHAAFVASVATPPSQSSRTPIGSVDEDDQLRRRGPREADA